MAVVKCLSVAWLLVAAYAAPPIQIPLHQDDRPLPLAQSLLATEKKRPLHGRFLQITDFHPDRFYEVYSSTSKDAACHRGQGPAGIYGAETSECDSPVSLINKTMEWIEKELKDSIDFVIWTGDSARHDNDEDVPRSEEQVLGLNELMVHKMVETFGKHNGDEEDDDPNNDFVVPIIPNIGNNDILPHNIFRKGPNKWTRAYSKMWRQFIPEAQRHSFEQGAWFHVEVIPQKLAVFSLNTLYFFNSNAAVDGCAVTGEPGYEQMEWLRIQLQFMRDRGMKAILIGHVPPARVDAKTNWDETCWQKYTLWLRQYRDVIVSAHYGHFNYDHFILQDFQDLKKGTRKGKMPDYEIKATEQDDIHAAVSASYFVGLRDAWSNIPDPPKIKGDEFWEDAPLTGEERTGSDNDATYLSKKSKKQEKYFEEIGGEYAERFAASFVSASVVPNLFPAIRVFEYNITGLDEQQIDAVDDKQWTLPLESRPSDDDDDDETTSKKKKKKKTAKKRYKFELPKSPSKTEPPGPAYSPQTFSLLRYTQYFANLTHINNDFHALSGDKQGLDSSKWNEGKHKGKKPHEKDHEPDPKKFKFELHYDTRDDDVYQLDDLTMPNLVDLARRIGKFKPLGSEEALKQDIEVRKKKKEKKHSKRNEAWFTFVRRAYVETLDPEELESEFGN